MHPNTPRPKQRVNAKMSAAESTVASYLGTAIAVLIQLVREYKDFTTGKLLDMLTAFAIVILVVLFALHGHQL